MYRIVVEIPTDLEDGSRKVAFQGEWLVRPEDDVRSGEALADAGIHYGVARTARGQLAVLAEHVNRGPIGWGVFEDVDHAVDEHCLPEDVADIVRARLEPEYVEELDI